MATATIKVTHIGEDYAKADLHVATATGGKTFFGLLISKAAGEWLEQNGSYDPDQDPCEYKYDGKDTDGTAWYLCIVHDQLALSPDAPCADYIEGASHAIN